MDLTPLKITLPEKLVDDKKSPSPNSTNENDSSSSSFIWKISTFSIKCKQQKPTSPSVFYASDANWQLELQPTMEFRERAALYLKSYKRSPVEVRYRLSILRSDRKAEVLFDSQDLIEFGRTDSCGKRALLNHHLVFDEKYRLPSSENSLITCELFADPHEYEEDCSSECVEGVNTVWDHMEDYTDCALTDVTFVFPGKVLSILHDVLVRNSKVFEDMIVKEVNNSGYIIVGLDDCWLRRMIVIDDINYDVFYELLRYMRTGRVKNIDKLADELLVAAEKFAVEGLIDLCKKSIEKSKSDDV